MLLDTSGLFAYRDAKSQHHSDAVTYFHIAPAHITHSLVLAEFVALAQARGLPRADSLEFVANLLDLGDVEVIWVNEVTLRVALDMLRRQLDKAYSLCDAVSFVLMTEREIQEALTTDYHFDRAGFRRLLTE